MPADFVSYEECETAVKNYLLEHHQGIENFLLGPALVEFTVRVATQVAWRCAAEATKRAAKKKPCVAERSVIPGAHFVPVGTNVP